MGESLGHETQFQHIKDVLMGVIGVIEKRATNATETQKQSDVVTVGLGTGIRDLDEHLGGLEPGQLIVLGGRPSVGKTSLGLRIASTVAVDLKKTAAYFTLESGKEQIANRVLASLSNVPYRRVRDGRLHDRDWKALAKTAGTLVDAGLFIDDPVRLRVSELAEKCQGLKAERGLDILIIDSLQHLDAEPSEGFQPRIEELNEISRNLKALARELQVPIILITQLSKGPEMRVDKRPHLSDLGQVDFLAGCADLIWFLYRHEMYDRDTEDRGIAELIVAKNRVGSKKTIRLAWMDDLMAFENLPPIELPDLKLPPFSDSLGKRRPDASQSKGLNLPDF